MRKNYKLLVLILAIPVGLIGVLTEVLWLKTLLCLLAGLVFGVGWVLDMKDRANDTLRRNGKEGIE